MYKKLTDEQIRDIAAMKAQHYEMIANSDRYHKVFSAQVIAQIYGVNPSTVYNIVNGKYPRYRQVLDGNV